MSGVDFIELFGPWGASLAVLAVVVAFFMRKSAKADEERAENERIREESRNVQTKALVDSMRDSINLLARAVDRFEAFEREEIRTHTEIFSGMKHLVDSQARIIETQSRLTETMARISDTQLQQKYLLRDIVRELKEARRDRRKSLGLPEDETDGGLQEPNGNLAP